MIIIDLDGTVVDSPSQKIPSHRMIDATKRLEESYFICAATGRAPSFARGLLRALHLKDPCIVSGGTSIVDPRTDEIIWRQSLDLESLKPILELVVESGFNVLVDDSTEEDYLNGGWPAQKILNIKAPYFLELVFVPKDQAHGLARKFSEIPNVIATVVVAQRLNTCDIHITHKTATKEHAIIELCKRLKTDRDNTIGVGDGHNDLHLFNAVNHKVAMGNAVPELIEAADEVIGSVQSDGLAEYFERLANP